MATFSIDRRRIDGRAASRRSASSRRRACSPPSSTRRPAGAVWGIVALRRGRARLGAHRGLRHPLRLGCVLDEEVRTASRLATHGVARPAASGSSAHPSLLSASHRRRRLRRAASRRRPRPVRRRSRRRRARRRAAGAPAHLALWHGLEPALWISLATIAARGGLFWLTTRRAGRAGCCPSRRPTSTTRALRGIARLSVVTTSFTQRGSLPVYVGTIFVVFVAAEGTALLAGTEWQAQLDAYQTPMQLVVAPIMIAAGLVAVRAQQALHGGRARLGHGPRHGAAVRHERRTRPGAHADPRRDGDARRRSRSCCAASRRGSASTTPRSGRSRVPSSRRAVGVTMALVAIVATAARIGQADLGVVPRPRRTSSATARTSSTSRSSTCAAGTRWASCRC